MFARIAPFAAIALGLSLSLPAAAFQKLNAENHSVLAKTNKPKHNHASRSRSSRSTIWRSVPRWQDDEAWNNARWRERANRSRLSDEGNYPYDAMQEQDREWNCEPGSRGCVPQGQQDRYSDDM